ncbi:MAG: hypothetical protein OEV30_01765 [Ignavibacteria bacterium]|nr:hypothetical protein [Ignavibacteria bacterium]
MTKPNSNNPLPLKPHNGSSSPLSADQVRRIELLKLQKELQRREVEREAWLRASTPRNAFTDGTVSKIIVKPAQSHQKPPRAELTFFSKLRLGKFLE